MKTLFVFGDPNLLIQVLPLGKLVSHESLNSVIRLKD
jgi:hypothetical protein